MDRDKIEAAIERLDSCTKMVVNLKSLSDGIHVRSMRELLPEILADLRWAVENDPVEEYPDQRAYPLTDNH
jgi:hypothetical protein